MDIQFIIAIGILLVSILYLAMKFIKPAFAQRKNDDSCGPNCNCS